MHKYAHFLFIVIFIVFISPAGAQEKSQKSDIKFNSFAEIPDILAKGLRANMYREKYLYSIMQPIIRTGDKNMALTQDFLDQKAAKHEAAKIRSAIGNVMQHDLNLDGVVEIEAEIIQPMKKRYKKQGDTHYIGDRIVPKQYIDHARDRFHKMDQNNDGKLTYEEAVAGAHSKRKASRPYYDKDAKYLAMDPNGDGKLEADELRNLAQATFAFFDRDGNGKISDDEFAVFQMYKKGEYDQDFTTTCPLPAISDDVQLTSIGVYGGAALSTVTTGGEDITTTAVDLRISTSNSATYLILTSYEPVIWSLAGNTDSIQNVVISQAGSNTGKSLSGIIGIPKNKVTFLDSTCLPYFSDMEGQRTANAIVKIQTLTGGRAPDEIFGNRNPALIIIDNQDIKYKDTLLITVEDKEQAIPTGYDPGVWKTLLHYFPAGLKTIDAGSVVSASPAKDYTVYPEMAGIAQYLAKGYLELYDKQAKKVSIQTKDGMITIIDKTGDLVVASDTVNDPDPDPDKPSVYEAPLYRTFRMVKSMPHYPAGLAGAHSVTFLISKGVKPPTDKPGHSCVMVEETGQVLSEQGLCN